MLRDRPSSGPALSGKWTNDHRLDHQPRARRDADVDSDVEETPQRSRAEELRWLNAPEYEIRFEQERRLRAYFERKREKAA